MRTKYLLPGSLRLLGIIFLSFGGLLGIARFYYGIKPDMFYLKVFALYSSYLESKYMEVIRNNFCEEIVALLITPGLFMIAFSKEKVENEKTNELRLDAFFISAYLNLGFIILSVLFTYGLAFVYMLMINICFFMLSYIFSFRLKLFLNSRKEKKAI